MKKTLFVCCALALALGAQAQWKPVGDKIKTPWSEQVNPANVLPEYPRPQLERGDWQNLNGEWEYAIKPVGDVEPATFDGKILVPFAVESSLSGVQKEVGENSELYIQVDPKKIVGVVETNWPDEARSFAAADPLTDKIGQNVADFLAADMKRGIIPPTFLPLQSGVGNIANAVLGALGRDKTIPPFEMYTEVIQNSVIGLIREGRVKFGSACSLTVTNDCLEGIYQDMDFFRDKLVLRPSEISNSPEVVRRLGIISINTAIEADIYGNVNSTHIGGTKMMNGIGGSGDFTRNAYISIFTCPSVAKEGKISAIVPMVSHMDHTEHDVNIIITEQGVADLRGKSPKERAQAIIENCVHPDYKNILWDYLKLTDGKSQTPHALRAALAMHAELAKSGDMKNVDWAQYK